MNIKESQYNRLTNKEDSFCTDCVALAFCKETCNKQVILQRLVELENKIENGELVFREKLIEEPNTSCLYHDKFFDIVTQVSKYGQVVTPIKET